MNYPVYNNSHAQPAAKSSSLKLIICAVVSILILVSVIIIGIGLGVGLGIGLRNKSKSSSSSVTRVLLTPTVNCTYINSSTCGCAVTKPTFLSSRIINGYTAIAHSWPWAVVIYYDNQRICGGFLITYQHVITAAHCVYHLTTKKSVQIYAGVHSLSSSTDGQIRDVSQMEIHPDFSINTFLNDIAILKLSASLIPATNVGLCCLSSDISLPIQNELAVIVGWGRIRVDSSSLPDTLQQAVVKIQGSSSECNANSNLDRQFCAGYESSDTCQGDSGGPLMTIVNNLWTCTGIVSFGIGCGNGGYYTRVSYYQSFIDNAILTL
jgi:transmembrane serine protease 2